jgi:hypothetical protein
MTLFTAQLEARLSQGDLFASDWDNDRTPSEGSVIVLSEGCDIDYTSVTVLVAATFPEADTEGGLMNNIRGGRVFWALHLEGMTRWVSLRTTHPIPKTFLQTRLDRRLCSMTPAGRMALAGKFFSFLTHSRPPKGRYFRDEQGVVWDVWEVKPIDIARLEDQFRKKVSPALGNGWLFMTSSRGSRRLISFPFGWQYLPDKEMAALLKAATPVDPRDGLASAADATARPGK